MKEKSLNTATKVSAILTCLSLIIGVVIGLIQVTDTLKKANNMMDALKVEALGGVIDILDTHYEILIHQATFDPQKLSSQTNHITRLLAQNKTGEQIYYSDTLGGFHQIAAHYERIAVLINLQYLEFEVIFDIITFPDNFWKNSFALRQLIAKNWNGTNQPLDDFLSGFRSLCKKYQYERSRLGYASAKGMRCE